MGRRGYAVESRQQCHPNPLPIPRGARSYFWPSSRRSPCSWWSRESYFRGYRCSASSARWPHRSSRCTSRWRALRVCCWRSGHAVRAAEGGLASQSAFALLAFVGSLIPLARAKPGCRAIRHANFLAEAPRCFLTHAATRAIDDAPVRTDRRPGAVPRHLSSDGG